MEARQRRSAEHASAVVREGGRGESEQGRACSSPAPATASTTRPTTAAHWTELSAGLPHAPVSWVVVQKQFHDVVVSTYGRGLYVLDDITPLEQATPATTDAAAHLFAPRAGLPLDAARPRADQLLAEGGAARRRCSSRCSTRTATVVRDLRADAARRAEPRRVGPALRAAAADRDADDAAGEPAHLGGAALPRPGHAAGHALGARAGAGRADCRARQVHA